MCCGYLLGRQYVHASRWRGSYQCCCCVTDLSRWATSQELSCRTHPKEDLDLRGPVMRRDVDSGAHIGGVAAVAPLAVHRGGVTGPCRHRHRQAGDGGRAVPPPSGRGAAPCRAPHADTLPPGPLARRAVAWHLHAHPAHSTS